MNFLDTDALSAKYRADAIDVAARRLLITNFRGTEQEKDFTVPANCQGFGRVRHFRRGKDQHWPANPLPLDPASRRLGLGQVQELRAQVFQNAVCNWRCWYCFVDFKLLSGSRNYSSWLSPHDLLNFYLAEPDQPPMIDLTGGQPDLTPEWVPWMMGAIRDRGLEHRVYLWSDDNLSNDYFWRYLSDAERDLVATYEKYGRVCCFKGFDPESFSFNTRADPSLFERQFELFTRFLDLGIDLYAYVTLTGPSRAHIKDAVRTFIDRLQGIRENLPLRTVPLEIQPFTPLRSRMNTERQHALENQYAAIQIWNQELSLRYATSAREMSIVDVPLGRRPSPLVGA